MKFKKGPTKLQALINSSNDINAKTLAYAAVLELYICLIDIGAQKMDGSTLLTYGMVFVNFQVENKLERMHFFQETF